MLSKKDIENTFYKLFEKLISNPSQDVGKLSISHINAVINDIKTIFVCPSYSVNSQVSFMINYNKNAVHRNRYIVQKNQKIIKYDSSNSTYGSSITKMERNKNHSSGSELFLATGGLMNIKNDMYSLRALAMALNAKISVNKKEVIVNLNNLNSISSTMKLCNQKIN